MGSFGKCPGGGRRAAPRTKTPLVAVFATLAETHSALVVDVSSTGVRIHGPQLPKMGEELVVTIEEVRAFGTVAWSENGECGISFDPPLSLEDEQALQWRVTAARGLPPDIKAAFDSWVLGAGR